MVCNRLIHIRVTKNQQERIVNNAHAKGYKTVSAYIRALALEHEPLFERKFNALCSAVLNEPIKQKRMERPLTVFIE